MPSTRKLIQLLAVILAVGALAGSYLISLRLSLDQLEAGLRQRDTAKLEKYIDWPVIRDRLRSEIRGTALRRVYEDAIGKQGSPGYFLGALFAGTIAPAMIDQFIDSFATPQGLVDLLGKNSGDRPTDLAITTIGFTDFDEYTLRLGKADADPSKMIRAVLRREGIIWRVVRIGFPPGETPWEAPVSTLKIEKIAPARTSTGLMIEGDILNTGSTPRDVPQLRIALRDAAEKEVQFKIIDPPSSQLAPGAVAHFHTAFQRADEKAVGVLVTFVPR
jgi:hypothetical protein